MKRLLISTILSILIMFNSVMPTMANTTTVNDNTIISLSSSSHMEISVVSTNGYQVARGGKIIGGAIGVNFTENVSVRAKYYTLRGYHEASNYYIAGFDGVERHVETVSSNAYNQRLYEGFTPHTWKDGDHLASNTWTAIFGRAFPYVKEYR